MVSPLFPEGYENEHTGAIVTNGVIELQKSVMYPSLGVVYPLKGLTLTIPSAPFPATTLLGATGLCTVIVNCGVTASTVSVSGSVVWLPDPSVPVMVIVYPICGVVSDVVIVAEAPPEPERDAGLTVQTGNDVLVICTVGVTVQLRLTGPMNPEPATTLTVVDETPPGATASGESGKVDNVKSCADAGAMSTIARRQKATRLPRPVHRFQLDSDPSDLNMSRLAFQYLRFLGESKSCPTVIRY